MRLEELCSLTNQRLVCLVTGHFLDKVQLKSLNLEQFYPGDMSSVAKAPVKPMNNNPFLRDLYSNILHQVVYHLGHSPSLLSSHAVKEDK